MLLKQYWKHMKKSYNPVQDNGFYYMLVHGLVMSHYL